MCLCTNYRNELTKEDLREMVLQAAIQSKLVGPQASPEEAVLAAIAGLKLVIEFTEQKYSKQKGIT